MTAMAKVVTAGALLLSASGNALFAQATPDNFSVAVAEEPDTLDMTSTAHAPGARVSLENITEGLWSTATDGALTSTVADWEISDDGLEIVFRIRDGITFHSGDPLTAEDVLFSHNRMLENAPQYARRARALDAVDVVDERTVRFTFHTPDAGMMPSRSLSIVSKAYFDRVGETQFMRHPVGTGPYEFVSYTPGTQLVLKRYDNYHGDLPQVEHATLRYVREAGTRLAQLQAGEVGMVMDIPYPDVPRLEADGFRMEYLAAHPTIAIQFHNLNPDVPWYDVRVRKAMAHAVDRQSIIDGLLAGVPEVTATVAEGELGHDPTITPYAYDPDRARELLAEAGYPDGFDLPLDIWGGGFAGLRETAEAASLYLRELGINVEVQTLDAAQFLGKIRNVSGDPEGVYVGISALPYANQSDPIEALNVAYTSRSPFTPFRDDRLDQYIDEANALLDPDARGEVLKKAFGLMHEEAAVIPLWNFVAVYAMDSGVRFTPTEKFFPVVMLKDVSFE
ncbi:ABC transporter substrate-binding protein [Roseinatronobacter alkalisoli]|uniref:ABC transporter substrate-binding protein n=1 Tax=Roseinatronobacter alkalisoli TaxID=3028235 RepID=A0ABT5T740_9RHOB|nr:ABC transporter substrate-binding protein [Roseinatronobacter sp. HJB301]MDD7970927.1 ABC transporter substrate-binding protein [Roseinatronobacter sp. HJB301]